MHIAGKSSAQPPEPADRRPAPQAMPTAARIRRTVALCVASFAVMAPWPLLGILALHAQFDHADEASLLFGGITAIPIAILTLIGLPTASLPPILVSLWIAAAVVPDIWFARRLASWRAVLTLLGWQAAFSLAQATMGAMMIVGKSV